MEDNGANSYRRFLEGDENAFDEIIRLYQKNLTFFIDRYVRDLAAAEDLMIDTLMELLLHRHRYNFKVKLKTYLFMIGRSKALNYLKHRNTLTMMEFSVAEAESEDYWKLEEAVISDERKRIVSEALEQLPEEMRAAIHLVYFEDMSYEDAAKIMKKNRKQVDNLLYRAKRELRSIIGKDGELLL